MPKLLVFDLDGTLYRGSEPIPGAAEALGRLRAQGYGIRFLTNNSGLTRQALCAKLAGMGFQAEESEVYGTAFGAARMLARDGVRSVFVVGEDGLRETLDAAGLKVVEQGAEAVLVGICRTFTYDLLNRAMQEIRNGAAFYATNTDASYPMEGGREIPGSGSLVAAIATCSSVSPRVVGKPEPYLLELISQESGVPLLEILVIGDRVETDLECARRAGAQGLLVLSGVSRDGWPDQIPDVTTLDRWL